MTEKTHETSVVLLESMTLNNQEKLSPKEQLTNLFNIVKDVEILTKEKYFIEEIKTQEDYDSAVKMNTAIASIKTKIDNKRKEIVKAYSTDINNWDDEIKKIVKSLQTYQDEHKEKMDKALKELLKKRTDIINDFVRRQYAEMNVVPKYQTAIFTDLYTKDNAVKEGILTKKTEQDIKARIQTALNTQLLHQLRIETIKNVAMQNEVLLDPETMSASFNLSEAEFREILDKKIAILVKQKTPKITVPTNKPEPIAEGIKTAKVEQPQRPVLTFEALIEVKAHSTEEAIQLLGKYSLRVKKIDRV